MMNNEKYKRGLLLYCQNKLTSFYTQDDDYTDEDINNLIKSVIAGGDFNFTLDNVLKCFDNDYSKIDYYTLSETLADLIYKETKQ
ncbi:hypothetical protein CKO50_20365 [Pseudoalteromonas sp. HM-SA03]|uniref:hypothetical protein n=1 Tax=Pseudoalteromonas sp. HM-SA03 TaxID=2029678 RepID=UPI000BAE6288|nr:hypothetical protein [Pseudoalteromonas sp. HM-SA03]PAX99568.1 hypothetical protein CKO50_20365 [Pseudoalteromonas sp. HM-SA03]